MLGILNGLLFAFSLVIMYFPKVDLEQNSIVQQPDLNESTESNSESNEGSESSETLDLNGRPQTQGLSEPLLASC